MRVTRNYKDHEKADVTDYIELSQYSNLNSLIQKLLKITNLAKNVTYWVENRNSEAYLVLNYIRQATSLELEEWERKDEENKQIIELAERKQYEILQQKYGTKSS